MHSRSIPQVKLTDSAVQRCFDAAVENLAEINTVPCDYGVYNATGLLNPDYRWMFRAGGDYQTPWTRDAAINTWHRYTVITHMADEAEFQLSDDIKTYFDTLPQDMEKWAEQ